MGTFNEDVEVNEVTVAKIDDGQKYITSTGRNELGDDASDTLYFENPSGSSLDSFVVFSNLASADAELEISTDVSQDGSGSELTHLNAKPLSGATPSSTVRSGDSYTVNGKTVSFNVPGGETSGPGSGGGSPQAAPTTFLLSPDTAMLFELYNRSGGTASMGLGMSWFEVDI